MTRTASPNATNGGGSTGVPQLLDIATLSSRLGVGERHVRRLVFERRIPYVKVGRYVRFDAGEIAHWVDAQRVPAYGTSSDWGGTGGR